MARLPPHIDCRHNLSNGKVRYILFIYLFLNPFLFVFIYFQRGNFSCSFGIILLIKIPAEHLTLITFQKLAVPNKISNAILKLIYIQMRN